VALVLFVAGWLAYRRRWRELSGFAVITIGGALLSEWVKSSCHGRGRARYPLSIDYGNSFPSGHVTSAATIFGAGYYFLGKPCGGQWWRRHLAIVGVGGMVSVIDFQRVYFTHHWLSDVVGGALLGCFLPSIVFLAVQIGGQSSPGRTIRRRLSRSPTAPFVPGQRPNAHGLARRSGRPRGSLRLCAQYD